MRRVRIGGKEEEGLRLRRAGAVESGHHLGAREQVGSLGRQEYVVTCLWGWGHRKKTSCLQYSAF